MASLIDEKNFAFLRTSVALPANALASHEGITRVFTRDNLQRPIVFIALATEPMLPGWIVSTKTILIKLVFKLIQLLCLSLIHI